MVELAFPGTRMWRRGANLEGDTANFVESEQIVEINGFKFSLLQVYPLLGALSCVVKMIFSCYCTGCNICGITFLCCYKMLISTEWLLF